jgi:hypothetical protein
MRRAEIKQGAALSLACFGGLLTAGLVAWFSTVTEPWTWKSALALLCSPLGFASAALVWHSPTPRHVRLGILVMLVSLVRLGAPWTWTLASLAVIAMTGLLALPLFYASYALTRPAGTTIVGWLTGSRQPSGRAG